VGLEERMQLFLCVGVLTWPTEKHTPEFNGNHARIIPVDEIQPFEAKSIPK
jgi:hypothetical protein